MTAAPLQTHVPNRQRRVLRVLRRFPQHAVLLAFSALMLSPIGVMVATSLKSNAEVYQNPIGFPRDLTFDNFVTTWAQGNFSLLFFNSALLTVTSMTAATLAGALAAYAIARSATRISSIVYLFIAIGIFLPMQLAIIPQFRLVRDLGLFNSYVGVILLYIAASLPFAVFLMTAFMRQVPRELLEAATLDGASYFGVFWRVYLPLTRPAIVTFWILQGVQIWNDYLVPLLIMTDADRRTLTTGVLAFKQQYVAQWGNLMAGVVIMTIPIVILFVIAQRQFTSGLYAGAVK